MKVVLKRGKEKFLQRGYPWVFQNQVHRVDGGPARGDIVIIEDASGKAYGQGFFHDESQIVVRFLTGRTDVEIDDKFFHARIARAVELREQMFGTTTHARLVFGESDGIPGTIVDRYGDVLTWTTLCYGVDRRRDAFLDILSEVRSPVAIVERNDADLRDKDGLEERSGVLRGTLPDEIVIDEAGVRYRVDVLNGPKTGFFIDQRINRQAVRLFARGRSVLDVFCADGGFGLHAAAAGADSVHAIDTSEPALDRLRSNVELNGFGDRYRIEQADALDRLTSLAQDGVTYDLVILDPPAFAKSKRHRESAKRAYQSININAFKLLAPGGILVTSSCSQAIDESHFEKIVRYAARVAGFATRRLARGSQSPDHPILDTMPETSYLKLFVYQKLADELPS